MSNAILIGQRVKLNANGSFTLPTVCEVRDSEIVLQRRYKGRKTGKITIPSYRFKSLDKPFRGVNIMCTIKSKI